MYKFRNLKAEEVEARVQSCDSNGFVLLIYKDARVDQNILDETVGEMNWQNDYDEHKGNLFCKVGILAESGEWIWKTNCGTESNTEKEKGEASDAFKRACFNWGIGRELYTSPKIKIKGHTESDNKGKYRPEYYEFEVTKLDISEDKKIIGLTIIGKSIKGGYHEDTIFDFSKGKKPTIIKQEMATKTQIKEIRDLEVNIDNVFKRFNIASLEELTKEQAHFIIETKKQALNRGK